MDAARHSTAAPHCPSAARPSQIIPSRHESPHDPFVGTAHGARETDCDIGPYQPKATVSPGKHSTRKRRGNSGQLCQSRQCTQVQWSLVCHLYQSSCIDHLSRVVYHRLTIHTVRSRCWRWRRCNARSALNVARRRRRCEVDTVVHQKMWAGGRRRVWTVVGVDESGNKHGDSMAGMSLGRRRQGPRSTRLYLGIDQKIWTGGRRRVWWA